MTDKGRLEAFSDGVFAVAITLLAFNLVVPALGDTRKGSLATMLGHEWRSTRPTRSASW